MGRSQANSGFTGVYRYVTVTLLSGLFFPGEKVSGSQ